MPIGTLVRHATLYTQFGPNSPEINAFELAGVTPEPKPWHIDHVHLVCTSVPAVQGMLDMDTITSVKLVAMRFTLPLRCSMLPFHTVTACSCSCVAAASVVWVSATARMAVMTCGCGYALLDSL